MILPLIIVTLYFGDLPSVFGCTLRIGPPLIALHFGLPYYALLPNDSLGHQARDHLANERTWLAYLRTSLAIASTGVGEFPTPCGIFVSLLTRSGPFHHVWIDRLSSFLTPQLLSNFVEY